METLSVDQKRHCRQRRPRPNSQRSRSCRSLVVIPFSLLLFNVVFARIAEAGPDGKVPPVRTADNSHHPLPNEARLGLTALQPLRINRWFTRLFLRRRQVVSETKLHHRPLVSAHRSQPRGDDPSAIISEETKSNSTVALVGEPNSLESRYHDASSALASTIASLVNSVLSDKRRLARITASSIQVVLVLYLAQAAWKALLQVLDEYSVELSAGSEPLFGKPGQVARALSVCEQAVDRLRESNPDPSSSPATSVSSSELIPAPLLSLIRRLLASGLPLRSNPLRPTSVESVLTQLTKTEAAVLQQCLWTPPLATGTVNNDVSNLQAMWSDVAGLFPVKERLLSAVASLRGQNRAQHAFRGLFEASDSISTSRNQGVLLFGPPGCGKTLLVRALATTAKVPCLVVTPSTLLRKYVGETNNQVRNLFSLAQKLAPCILCIDELDGLFRERSDSEHEVSRDLKTEFLQWWDGMLSDPSTSSSVTTTSPPQPILVIGASNRPFDVDAAVLRRLSASYYVGLPDTATRACFLRRLLEKIPSDVNVHRIATVTEGYSPSDLRQLLQSAAVMGPMREFSFRRKSADADDTGRSNERIPLDPPVCEPPRNLETSDVLAALKHSPPTPMSGDYRRSLCEFARLNLPISFGENSSAGAFVGDELSSTARDKWETDDGTFYHLGQLNVDPQTFDVLSDVMSQYSSQSDESTDSEEEETDLD